MNAILMHLLENLVNIFSCKAYDPGVVAEFTKKWFDGKLINSTSIERK